MALAGAAFMAGMAITGGMAQDTIVSQFIFRMGMAGTPDRGGASYMIS